MSIKDESTSDRKHTPGPWKYGMQFGEYFVRNDPQNWDGNGYQHIACLPASKKGTFYGDTFKANAQLIAAAPELLDELEVLVRIAEAAFDMIDDAKEVVEARKKSLIRAKRLIAKAKGEDDAKRNS